MKSKAHAHFLWRVGLFVGFFVIVSGVLGSKIIGGNLLQMYHFDIYGSLGKALLFAVVVFGMLVYSRLDNVQIRPLATRDFTWLAAALLFFVVAYFGVSTLLSTRAGGLWPVLTHLSLLASILCAAIGCLGMYNILGVTRMFKQELLVSIGLTGGFLVFLYAVYALWKAFAGVVLYSVHALLNLSNIPAVVVPPRSLVLDKFGIEVAQYCSGIESIALFTGLYVVIGVLDWRRFNHRRYVFAFIPALLVLFALNILRVYGLVLAGYHINKEIAFSLFHSYAAMIFFIIYSAIFWRIAYGWMVKEHQPKELGRES